MTGHRRIVASLLCMLALLWGCTTAPAAAPPKQSSVYTVQGIQVPDPEGRIARYFADYASAPGHKAIAVATDGGPAYAAGTATQGASTLQAVLQAMQQCQAQRVERRLDAPCELLRSDDREYELGRSFRQRLRFDDLSRPILLWKFQHGDSIVFVGGVMHALRASVLPLPPAFDKVYAASADLTVEVDTSTVTPTQVEVLLQKYGTLPAGQTVEQLLPADLVNKLRARATDLGAPWSLLEHLRPAQITTSLTQISYITNGVDSASGIDVMYLARAHLDGKPVRSLETLDDQFALLAAAPLGAVRQFVDAPQPDAMLQAQLQSMQSALFAGDEHALFELFDSDSRSSDPELVAWNKRFGSDRNVGMAAQVAALLRTGKGTHLVLVGAGHVVGPQSVVALLRTDGFTAVRLNRAGEALAEPATPNTSPALPGTAQP